MKSFNECGSFDQCWWQGASVSPVSSWVISRMTRQNILSSVKTKPWRGVHNTAELGVDTSHTTARLSSRQCCHSFRSGAGWGVRGRAGGVLRVQGGPPSSPGADCGHWRPHILPTAARWGQSRLGTDTHRPYSGGQHQRQEEPQGAGRGERRVETGQHHPPQCGEDFLITQWELPLSSWLTFSWKYW